MNVADIAVVTPSVDVTNVVSKSVLQSNLNSTCYNERRARACKQNGGEGS